MLGFKYFPVDYVPAGGDEWLSLMKCYQLSQIRQKQMRNYIQPVW